MNNEEFEKILNKRIELIKATLLKKGVEYSGQLDDRMHNFKRAAQVLDITSEETLLGMKVKHDVSVMDIVTRIVYWDTLPSEEMLQEKIGDSINYLILLEAMILERIRKQKEK